MDRLSLEPGHWYAAELLGEEFGTEIRSYSPIRVEEITPQGGRRLSLAFYHANYPEGVRSKVGWTDASPPAYVSTTATEAPSPVTRTAASFANIWAALYCGKEI